MITAVTIYLKIAPRKLKTAINISYFTSMGNKYGHIAYVFSFFFNFEIILIFNFFEWIKMWYTYTTEYYSTTKKKEIMPFAATWMDLEITMLSEVNQRETNIIQYHLHVESKKMVQVSLFTKQK